MNRSRWVIRGLAGAVLFACLAGPTPGNVGGCGSQSVYANAAQYCTDKATWTCEREHAGGRMSDDDYHMCRARITTDCGGTTWPVGCNIPTTDQTNQCIDLLRDPDLLPTRTDDLLAMFPDACNLCSTP